MSNVERDQIEAATQPVIQRQRQCHDWTIVGVRRKAAERSCVGEEARNIRQVADEDIPFDRVGIVEVEGVVQRVRVGA